MNKDVESFYFKLRNMGLGIQPDPSLSDNNCIPYLEITCHDGTKFRLYGTPYYEDYAITIKEEEKE